MSNAFAGRLVPGESLVIKTTGLVVSLTKASSDDIRGLDMVEGDTRFRLPRNLGDLRAESISAKVRRFESNLMTFLRVYPFW